jgi:energy-coupling factor transporter ATP-binding protein EcfA2
MNIGDFDFKRNGREYKIACDFLDLNTREQIARKYFARVGRSEPWIYRENVSGGMRTAKPLADQRRLFFYNISKTLNLMQAAGFKYDESKDERIKWTSKERSWVRWRLGFINELARELEDPTPVKPTPLIRTPEGLQNIENTSSTSGTWIDNGGRELIAERIEPLPANELDEHGNVVTSYKYDENKKVVPVKHTVIVTIAQKLDLFYKKMMQARSFVQTRELAGQYLDFISTRAIGDGCRAIYHGISVDEIMVAVTKTWPKDSKNELKSWTTEWTQGDPTINFKDYSCEELPTAHRYLGYVMCLANARVPIFLVGPSGCGKSFLARDLSMVLDLEYGELPLTAGATPSWLVGAETITGYKSRPFVEIYRDGGVFCFEELDAADPNMLLLVNNAIANDYLTNPVTGEEIEKHDDFIAIATANTWGLGANRQFTGRERLDAATLDRWRVGRIEMDYDTEIERAIINQWKEREKPRKRPVVKARKVTV